MSADAPIQAILKEIKVRGLRVHNIHHRSDGMWAANLRQNKPDEVNTTPRTKAPLRYYAWGRGPDMLGALESALERCKSDKKFTGKVIHDDERQTDDPPMGLDDTTEAAVDVDTLIANLLD